MDDDQLRSRFRETVGDVEPRAVESALTAVRRSGVRRFRRRGSSGWFLPMAVAAATVAVILSVIQSTRGPDPHRHVPTPAASVLPAVNAWYRHVGPQLTNGGVIDQESIWVVRLTGPDTGTFDVEPHASFGLGTLRREAGRRWQVRVLTRTCDQAPATYTVTRQGDALAFAVVADACVLRRTILDGIVFAPLTSPDQLVG
jgi:hypothetical protein